MVDLDCPHTGQIRSRQRLWEEAMFTGLLLKESLADESILDTLRVTETEVWDVDNAVDWQPRRWTALTFEGDDDQADAIARQLSRVMKPAWYANFSTETHAYVVFAGRFSSISRAIGRRG